ncbi:MAG: SURF1 family cytochrome oxidase biogenesis protein [Lacisediminihabitans sp.]
MLALALVIAAGFAALSQWQLSRAIETGTVVVRATETPVPLAGLVKPQTDVTDKSDGQLVTASGVWAADDYIILSKRLNRGTDGYWVVGHLAADTGTSAAGLPVALGWTRSEKQAKHVAAALSKEDQGPVKIMGRYLNSEAPQDTDFQHNQLSSLAAGTFVNLWQSVDPAGMYGGFVVLHSHVAGLDRIDSPAPTSDVQPDLLNIFYAIEWVVFAGFAFFLWYRLVKDTWERELEEELEVLQAADADTGREQSGTNS